MTTVAHTTATTTTADHNAGRHAYHTGLAHDAIPAPQLQGWMAAATESANEAQAKAIAQGRQPDPWHHTQPRQ